jgi:hypothetical protein
MLILSRRTQSLSMKKYVLGLLLIVTLSDFSVAQKLSLGLSSGFAQPLGTDAKGGWLFTVEPGITLAKKLRVGLRYQFSYVVRGLELPSNMNGPEYDYRSTNAYGVFTQYHILDKDIRPFVGMGFNYYRIGGVYGVLSNDKKWELIKAKNYYGGFINTGVIYKKISLTVDYHIVPITTERLDLVLDGTLTKVEVINQYMGVGIGYIIGKI